ncbi:MAG: S41 family peptidase [Candidatus Margulisiibacteriota bacterium]|jgi:carboxyl-terminal processing protease
MRNNRKLQVGLAILLISVTAFFIGKVVAQGEFERKFEVYLQALDLVRSEYVDKGVDNQKLVYGSIRGMLESLDDPYTRFLEPQPYKEMKIRMSGQYFGIGIYIGMKDNQLAVISPIDGTPADKAGLRSGDRIVKIDDKETKHMALDEAVSLIRGPRGSKVKLAIWRKGWKDSKDYSLSREKIVIKSVVVKRYEPNVLYIKLNTFENMNAAREFEKALRENRDAGGLIIDVRGNGGGLLQMAIEIGSMFIPNGAIVQTVDREGKKEQLESTGRVIWKKPVVMLINESSASASEILAGALRDHKVATLVGAHSFGKASVQNVRQLQDGSALLLTIAKYQTPNGEDINKRGISAEVVVAIPTGEADDAALPGDKTKNGQLDAQLKKAIETLKEKIAKAGE